MAATKAAALWGIITDIIAVNRNADDGIIAILQHSRDPYIIEHAGRSRRELEKERQALLKLRDMRQEE